MPYVFGYGSLVDRASLEASLQRELDPSDGPFPMRLMGYRRAWNVIGDSRERSDYVFTDVDGSPWHGWIAFLGLEQHADAVTPGVAWRLRDADLPSLDARERSYERVDVTSVVVPITLPAPGGTVMTYMPRPDVVQRSSIHQQYTVMARYLRLVERGYGDMGAAVYAEHRSTFPEPDPAHVREIVVRPADPGTNNEAVDPGHAPPG